MEEKKKSLVALVRCSSYNRDEVESAVAKAIELLGGFDAIMPELAKDAELLLKPNLLAKSDPAKAVTTHPEVFRAVGKALKDAGYSNLKFGDSPGNPMFSPQKTADSCGLMEPARELGIELGNFEEGVEVAFAEGRTAQKFVLCDEVARVCGLGPYAVGGAARSDGIAGAGGTAGVGVDGTTGADGTAGVGVDGTTGADGAAGGIINICKMKTHALERITGAVKNTFGCVQGVNKTASHATYANAEHFARMLVDLNRLVVPKLHIMDGIVAMEGNGPGSGDPVQMNVILASTDPVALDACFCHLVRLDTEFVPTNVAGHEAGIGTRKHDEIEVVLANFPMLKDETVMPLDEVGVKYGNRDFNIPRNADHRGNFRIMHLLSGLLEKKPVVLEEKCVGCGICVEACPVGGGKPENKAIALKRRVAMYNYDKCIRCYCCQEMCPEKAISVKKSFLAKLADRHWRI